MIKNLLSKIVKGLKKLGFASFIYYGKGDEVYYYGDIEHLSENKREFIRLLRYMDGKQLSNDELFAVTEFIQDLTKDR